MQEQQTPHSPATTLMTKEMLNGLNFSSEIFGLEAVKQNWLNIYKKTSGQDDGQLRYEAEKVMALQLFSGSKELSKCTRESMYSVWMELALSGLSLRDGLTYVIAYKDKATFQVGWKGRLEQINQMPWVTYVQEPQVVYDCDEFKFQRGPKVLIISHTETYPRPADAKIIYVYLVIYSMGGERHFIMNREEVLSIRDNSSKSYKQYLKDLPNVKDGKILRTSQSGSWWADFEPPMWVSSEPQAFRKTLVKRVYNNMEKLPHQKQLDTLQNARDYTKEPEYWDKVSKEMDLTEGMQVVESPETNIPYAEEVKPDPIQQQPQQAQQPEPRVNPASVQGSGRAQTTATNQPQQSQPLAQQQTNFTAPPPEGNLFGQSDDLGDLNEPF